MTRRFISVGLLSGLIFACFCLPATPVLAQKKAKAAAAKVDPVDSGKFAPNDYTGILKTTPGSDRMFNVECMHDRLVPTANKNNNRNNVNNRGNRNNRPPNLSRLNQAQSRMNQAMQQGQQAQIMLANARTPQQRSKAQGDLSKARNTMNQAESQYQAAVLQVLAQENTNANAMMAAAIRKYKLNAPAGYRIEKLKTLVEFQARETIKVRTMVLPEEFDEKGNPKKYTKAELATLKGKDTQLPGYESSLEKLEVGQKVRVTLVHARKSKTTASAKAKDEDADKEPVAPKDPKDSTEKKMQVRLILILADANATPTSPGDPKKKKQ